MKKLLLFLLLLSSIQIGHTQKDYSKMLEKCDPLSVIDSLTALNTAFEAEEAGRLFEQASRQDKLIKEKKLWDFFKEAFISGNFMEPINVERIAKIMNKDHYNLFWSWYGEKHTLEMTAYILSGPLWNFEDNEKALVAYLKTIVKDDAQALYITRIYCEGYYAEMGKGEYKMAIDYEKMLDEKLKATKKEEAKADVYKEMARLSLLMGYDIKKSLAWAENAKKIKADKELYFILSEIYGQLARTGE